MSTRMVLASLVLLLGCGIPSAVAQQVTPVHLPDDVYRPQIVVDAANTTHLVYANKTIKGDLYYRKLEAGRDGFSEPIKVNSTPNCAAGFNMALGKDNRVHVVIRPTAPYFKDKLQRAPKFVDLAEMLYCRLNDDGTAFEPERDLSGATFAFEGVAAVLADEHDNVLVYWHGLEAMGPETSRKVYLAKSTDAGRTFSAPQPITVDPIGACACCSMQGALGPDGTVYLVYRNSLEDGAKNTYLLKSHDGLAFDAQLLEEFPNAGCPGSVFALAVSPQHVYAAWDTEGHVGFAQAGEGIHKIPAADGERPSRTPALAINANGDVLFAWSQATNPQRFMQVADLAWQVFDKNGHAKSDRKHLMDGAVALWSMPAVAVKPNGDFLIFHDGPGPAKAEPAKDGPVKDCW